MNKVTKILISVPLYFFAVYGAATFLADLLLISDKSAEEKIFLSIFIAVIIAILERYFVVKKSEE